MLSPALLLRPQGTIVAPLLLLGALQTLLGYALDLGRHVDPRGVGFLALSAVACALVETKVATRTPRSPRLHIRPGSALRSLGVIFAFAPALAFPALIPLLLAAVTFLLRWLAESMHLGAETTSSRQILMEELGFAPSLDSPWPVFGLASLIVAVLCTLGAALYPGAGNPLALAIFFFSSCAAWEQVFLAFHSNAQRIQNPIDPSQTGAAGPSRSAVP